MVVVVKETLFRTVLQVSDETGSTAVKADAWHHRSDAITSAAAFVGIAIALWGGPGWESADDWAALVAAGVIAINGVSLLRPAVRDLMDRMPDGPDIDRSPRPPRRSRGSAPSRSSWSASSATEYLVDLHVQADPSLPLLDAHILSGKVKGAIRAAVPAVKGVLIHMEPYACEGREADARATEAT